MEGRVERIWITELACDGVHLVGHTKGYVQVLVVAPESMLGTTAIVKITSVGRWSVFGEVIETIKQTNGKAASTQRVSSQGKWSPFSDTYETCACSTDPEPCSCGPESCGGQITVEGTAVLRNDLLLENKNRKNLFGWLPRKRNNRVQRMENENSSGSKKKQEWARGSMGEWGGVDRALLGGMLASILTIAVLLIHLGFRTLSSE